MIQFWFGCSPSLFFSCPCFIFILLLYSIAVLVALIAVGLKISNNRWKKLQQQKIEMNKRQWCYQEQEWMVVIVDQIKNYESTSYTICNCTQWFYEYFVLFNILCEYFHCCCCYRVVWICLRQEKFPHLFQFFFHF